MLSIENVFKSFDKKIALDDINLSLGQGQIHVFLGSSGAGKSTLLRIIMGLTKLDKGYVRISGTPISEFTSKQISKKIGYLPQAGGLFPHMTAKENVTLMARLNQFSLQQINSRLNELCQMVGLNETLLNRYPRELSGGQQQRVALMRALFLDPGLLVLDEPLGALDPIIRAELQTELRDIFRKVKKTVLLVTHDLGEAAFFGDTVSLFHGGKVIQSGSFKDLVERPATAFVADFIKAQRSWRDYMDNHL